MTAKEAWRREGLVLTPPPAHAWWHSHAQVPTILPLDDRLWRVYFSARDSVPCSRILCADIDPGDGFRVTRIYTEPLLELGRPRAFDSHGMGPSCVLAVNGTIHLYYMGIVRRPDVPYQIAIGLAVSDDGLDFRKVGDGPVLSTGPHDPLFVTAPYVRYEGGFEMWYASGIDWRPTAGMLEPFYALRHTWSGDGVTWSKDSRPVLELGDGDAGLTRPSVLERSGNLHLWYCRRGAEGFRGAGSASYRLQHAVLDDQNAAGACAPLIFENPPAAGDWDSWMQAYPCVVPYGDDLIMFYNGNDFGRGGFGRARLPGGARSGPIS